MRTLQFNENKPKIGDQQIAEILFQENKGKYSIITVKYFDGRIDDIMLKHPKNKLGTK
jgi:hypothetical protein